MHNLRRQKCIVDESAEDVLRHLQDSPQDSVPITDKTNDLNQLWNELLTGMGELTGEVGGITVALGG